MTRIVLDAASLGKLHNLTQPLELCDETGAVRAQLIPVLNPDDYEPVPPPPLADGELERRRNGSQWFTTPEVLKHLESL